MLKLKRHPIGQSVQSSKMPQHRHQQGVLRHLLPHMKALVEAHLLRQVLGLNSDEKRSFFKVFLQHALRKSLVFETQLPMSGLSRLSPKCHEFVFLRKPRTFYHLSRRNPKCHALTNIIVRRDSKLVTAPVTIHWPVCLDCSHVMSQAKVEELDSH